MFNLKSKIYHLGSKKGEIATLLTLGLVLIGAVITLGSSFFTNKQKSISSNPKASYTCELPINIASQDCSYGYTTVGCQSGYAECKPAPTVKPSPTKPPTSTCPYTCTKYNCSSGYVHNTSYSCSGIDMVCCQKSLVSPTKTSTPIKSPTPSSDGCHYLNPKECSNDCLGNCSRCTNGRYKCVARTPTVISSLQDCGTPIYIASNDCSYGYTTVGCKSGTAKCKSKPISVPTPTRSAEDLFNKDCRCINGLWGGGGCDSWQRGRSCLPTGLSQCRQNNQRCGSSSDTSCCSGYCVPTPHGFYCQSANIVAKGCTSLTTKCDGNYLMKCYNGAWVKDKLCDSCQTSLLGPKCAETSTGGTAQISKSPTVNGKACTTKNNWLGTCTLSSNCNSIAAGIAWDSSVAECKSPTTPIGYGRGGVGSYGCCGSKSNNTCSQKGLVQKRGEKCFSCFLTNKPEGEMIEVSMSFCENVASGNIATMNNSEIMLNATSTEDQYHLRQNAFDIFEESDASFGMKTASWLMEQADSVTYYTFGQLPKIFGGEAESSMGNYYVAQMDANAAAEAQGITREVTVGQALTTGVIGGYQFANNMLLGIPDGALNLVTGGKTENWETNTLTSLYGADEAAAATKTIAVGHDIANIVTILIPVGKGLSAAGGKMTSTAAKLEQAGQTGVRSALLRGGGKTISVAGEGFQIISPETWAAGFIKNAPVTRALETGAAAIKATKLVTGVSDGLFTVTNTVRRASPIIDTTLNVGSKIKTTGAKVVDFLLPKSALEYNAQEVATNIAKDINLGIVEPENVTQRLLSRYRQEMTSGTQIQQITNELKNTNLDEKIVANLSTQLNLDLQNKLVEQILKGPSLGQRIKNAITGGGNPNTVVVVPDLHSDTQALAAFLEESGVIDVATGKVNTNVKVVFNGDYFGKTTSELVSESATPGYDILKKVVGLQDETGGKIIAGAGNWEPSVAYATRLNKLQQVVDELNGQGNFAEAQKLLEGNGFENADYLKDELSRFLKLNKGVTGGLPLSHEELNIITFNSDELAGLMGKLKFMTSVTDGTLSQHVDTPELLQYAFNSVDEIKMLDIDDQSKTYLLHMIEARGGSKTVTTSEEIRQLGKIFDQLDWNSDTVIQKVNNNASQIMQDGITKLDDIAAINNLRQLERDMSKDLGFYTNPESLVAYSEIFGTKGNDFRLVHGHSPLTEITKALQSSSAYQEVGRGVWYLKDDPRIIIQGIDVNLSRGMRVRGEGQSFLPVLNGIMQIPENVERSGVLSGLNQVLINLNDPIYGTYSHLLPYLKKIIKKGIGIEFSE